MNETTARPLDSDQNVTNQGLLGKLEAANKSMEEIKVLNNTTRDLVSDDLKVLSLIENPLEANEALIVIGHKAKIQPIYRTELQESNPDVSKKAEDALHKYELKLIEDEREATIGQVDKSKGNTISQNSRARQSEMLEEHEPNHGTVTDINKTQRDRFAIPDNVSSRYLKLENKYFMPDKSVAFEDHGNKLKLETENRTVILDALKIAESRGWESINVSGSKNFMHQVWREASIQGMDVTGYKPTALEIAELNHAMLMREERVKEKETRYDTPDNYISPMPEKNTADLRGVLVAYGADHYRHDPSQSQSYFVTLDVGNGKEITRWGSDLKRAFAESQSLPQVGDDVVLGNKGKKDIPITTTVLDDHGNPVEENKTVQKNLWQIEKASYQETLEEQAEALRVGQEIEDKVIAQVPQLAAALAVSKLGEKIAQQAKVSGALKSQDEVDTIVYLIREGLSAALKEGRKIKTLEIREQGQQAAVDANNIINDHKPHEITKEPPSQEMVR